jgi:anti-sigma regulatory factor (Ser/Thr protein kinase)
MNRVAREFRGTVYEVGHARGFAREVLSEWGVLSDDAELVVGELASNAVLHTDGNFKLCLCRGEEAVVVEVTDSDPRCPRVELSYPRPRSGRGLLIVEAVSSSWGSRVTPEGGKTVWAKIPTAQGSEDVRSA